MTKKTNEELLNEAVVAVGELRKEFEKTTPNLEKINKLNTAIEAQDEVNQKLQADARNAEKAMQEMEDRYKALEADLARAATASPKSYKDSDEYKAFEGFIRYQKEQLPAIIEEKGLNFKTLRSDSDAAGGYLAPVQLDTEMVKKITEISNIRSISRVRTISAKQMDIAKRSTIPTATYEGELESAQPSESSYASESIVPFRQTFYTDISMDLLMDSAWNMESELMTDAGEAFSKGEGAGFVSGTGFKEPEGFLTNAEIVAAVRTSSTSATIDPEDVILLTGDLKVGYDPVYVMNRRTLAFLRTLKSTTGSFLWQPGLNGPVANTLNGFPYLIADDMPDIASNSLSIAFGDFRRGYTITDRTGLAVIRDELTLAGQAAVRFYFRRWNTGQVILAEAIKVLKTAA